MNHQTASEEYALALRRGQKEYKELLAAGKDPYPAVLDTLLPDNTGTVQELGLIEIPAHRIVGVKSAGRIAAFTRSFRPLLEARSEFAFKWINLCQAHLGETGITDPILCYEYLGNFYVQEGNKRVSVLRHFGATRIPAHVRRILPPAGDDPRLKAYGEFLEFYKATKLYAVQIRRPGDYGKLLSHLGKTAGEVWTEEERRNFNSGYHYFQEAFDAQKDKADVLTEEALLMWLEFYPFRDLTRLSAAQLKKTLSALWKDMMSVSREDSVKVQTRAVDQGKAGFLNRVVSVSSDMLQVAFVHQLNPAVSAWVLSHEEGKEQLERTMGDPRRGYEYRILWDNEYITPVYITGG
jgi:hypothetical protein